MLINGLQRKTPEVEIERSKTLFDVYYQGDGVQYWVFDCEHENAIGDAQVLLYPVGDLVEQFDRPHVRKAFLEMGLSDKSIVADVNDFWPNGRPQTEEALVKARSRQGVGTMVLEAILLDARKAGAEAVYVFTKSSSMREFLTKNGFLLMETASRSAYFQTLSVPKFGDPEEVNNLTPK